MPEQESPHNSIYLIWFFVSVLVFVSLATAIIIAISISAYHITVVQWIAVLLFCVPSIGLASQGGRLLLGLFIKTQRVRPVPIKPIDRKVVIAIPVIIRSEADIDASVSSVEACGQLRLPVYLLVDFSDAATQSIESDAVLRQALASRLTKAATSEPDTDRVIVLERERLFNASDRIWMGWERKRGKLDEFCRLLRGAKDTSFRECEKGFAPSVDAIITLDIDSRIEPSTIDHLVSHAWASMDGPTFVTPSIYVGTDQPPTLFHQLHAIGNRISGTEFFEPSLAQRVFGRELFYGKGLVVIDRYLERVAGKIKDNSVLSHDHLEAMLGGSQQAPGAILYEDFPATRKKWEGRQLRWMRGDLQLLPLLGMPELKNWGRLIIVENAANHIASAGVVLAVALSARAQNFLTIWVLALALLSPAASLFPITLLDAIVRREISIRNVVLATGQQLRGAGFQIFYNAIYALANARLAVIAVCVVFYRLVISKSGLLEWNDREPKSPWLTGAIVILIVLVTSCTGNNPHFAAQSALPYLASGIWLLGPSIVRFFSDKDRIPGSKESSCRRRQGRENRTYAIR